MREVIKTIFFLVGVFGVCFEASFLVFFRRFSDCSKAFLTGFFFFFAKFCTNMQTQANVGSLAVAVLHGSCTLSSPLYQSVSGS